MSLVLVAEGFDSQHIKPSADIKVYFKASGVTTTGIVSYSSR